MTVEGIASGWRDRVATTVAREGFATALRHHVGLLREAHRLVPVEQRLADLHHLMSCDPQLRDLLPELELPAVPADASPAVPADASPAVQTDGSPAVPPAAPSAAPPAVPTGGAPLPDLHEADGSRIRMWWRQPFANWGGTVHNVPDLTATPRSVAGVQALVRWARDTGRTVRAAGYRHSWTDLFSAQGQVLISMLPPSEVMDRPTIDHPLDPHDDLQGIRLVGTVEEDGVTKALCRVGAATTNDQFRTWCLASDGGDWAWTLPVNTIIVEITFGGSNATICHGAGSRHRTLNDLVTSVELVNARGEVQVVDDAEQLRAAAGCLGLLGIVTAVTFKLEPMTYAVLQPVRRRLALTIPPPPGFAVPAGVDMTGVDQAAMDAAWTEFVRACQNDYYAEWFWFPYQRDCWINTWADDGTREAASRYPDELETLSQEVGEYVGDLVTSSVFRGRLVPGRWQALLLGSAAMASLPTGRIVTPVIDAIHFRRGVHDMPVLDLELEIPVPASATDPTAPDWTVCRDAWWAAVAATYADPEAPMRITLEMRVTADSALLLAPQRGNTWGTCSIEVLTEASVDPAAWDRYLQTLVDAWCDLRGADGQPLNVRPHWAKQWQGLNFRGRPAVEHLRDIAYREEIPAFRTLLLRAAAAGGCTAADLAVFAHPLLNELFDLDLTTSSPATPATPSTPATPAIPAIPASLRSHDE